MYGDRNVTDPTFNCTHCVKPGDSTNLSSSLIVAPIQKDPPAIPRDEAAFQAEGTTLVPASG